MSDFGFNSAPAPSNSVPASSPEYEIRYSKPTAADLLSACLAASEAGGEVVVAVRTFPSNEYEYIYDRHDIAIVCAKLSARGYSVDTRIAMDNKCSKVILSVESDVRARREVYAERITAAKSQTAGFQAAARK